MQEELLVAGFFIFATLLLGCLRRQEKEEEAAIEPRAPKYCERYMLNGDAPFETEKNKSDRQVEDEVEGSGLVVVRNLEEGKFEYWADKAVAYPDLETLARKWALVFNQLSVYKERSRVVTVKEQAVEKSKDNVFAVLKTYQKTPSVTVKEQANTYLWRGKLRDMAATEPTTKPPLKAIRYSDFKKNVDQS